MLVAFQTLMELRYGALRAGWGELRRRRLERRVGQITVVQPDDATISACAELRHRCQQAGHALADKVHDGDRWIAARRSGSACRSSLTMACSSAPPTLSS